MFEGFICNGKKWKWCLRVVWRRWQWSADFVASYSDITKAQGFTCEGLKVEHHPMFHHYCFSYNMECIVYADICFLQQVVVHRSVIIAEFWNAALITDCRMRTRDYKIWRYARNTPESTVLYNTDLSHFSPHRQSHMLVKIQYMVYAALLFM